MSSKEEFIAFQKQQNEKLTFALNEHGHITHVIKRADGELFEVFRRLKGVRCIHLPMILDVAQVDSHVEVHEEYIRGKTLAAIREEEGTLTDDVLLRVARDVCEALLVIHGMEPPMVHRDIKPENIMERESGGYVLIDFDGARLYRKDLETDTKLIATVGYAAPEQYGLSQTDVRSDLFSLGVTLYELKTGEPYRMGAVCPGKLGSIIAKCTAFEPKKRFQSAGELMKRLTAVEQKPRRRLQWILGGATCLVTLLSLGFALHRAGQTTPAMSEAPPAVPSAAATPTAAVAPAAAVPCTCEMIDFMLTTESGGEIAPFAGEGPATVPLVARGRFVRDDCGAETHIEAPVLTACRILEASVGAEGSITEDGVLTVSSPGLYRVDGFLRVGDKMDWVAEANILVTAHPAAYESCQCVVNFNVKDALPSSRQTLPADGSPLRLNMNPRPEIDDRICTAAEHKELLVLPGFVDKAPEGAEYTLSGDNIFEVSDPGRYGVKVPYYFGGVFERCGVDFEISEVA